MKVVDLSVADVM